MRTDLILFYFYSEAPGFPSITSTAADIEVSSLTVRWTVPADDGGSPITAYRVVILQGDNEIMNANITDPAVREKLIERLNRNTSYNVKVYARNYVFEGDASQKNYKTDFEGRYCNKKYSGLKIYGFTEN